MRIVGGRFKGRRLESPADRRIRPTSDRAREALFNLLGHGPYGGPAGPMPIGRDVLDVFAGSGALGLEALSRGARHISFIENAPDALRLLKQNSDGMATEDDIAVVRRDATRPGPAPRAHDLVLMDPPYHSGLAYPALAALVSEGWLSEDGIIAIELAKDEAFETPSGFDLLEDRRYGAARLVILRRAVLHVGAKK